MIETVLVILNGLIDWLPILSPLLVPITKGLSKLLEPPETWQELFEKENERLKQLKIQEANHKPHEFDTDTDAGVFAIVAVLVVAVPVVGVVFAIIANL
jgi:hypothetical protein